jgi:hypothetical protein
VLVQPMDVERLVDLAGHQGHHDASRNQGRLGHGWELDGWLQERARIRRDTMESHRIAGAGKQPSMRPKSAERSIIAPPIEAAVRGVTRWTYRHIYG